MSSFENKEFLDRSYSGARAAPSDVDEDENSFPDDDNNSVQQDASAAHGSDDTTHDDLDDSKLQGDVGSQSIDCIHYLGTAKADKLRNIGICTVADLARQNPADLKAKIHGDWVEKYPERAQAFIKHELERRQMEKEEHTGVRTRRAARRVAAPPLNDTSENEVEDRSVDETSERHTKMEVVPFQDVGQENRPVLRMPVPFTPQLKRKGTDTWPYDDVDFYVTDERGCPRVLTARIQTDSAVRVVKRDELCSSPCASDLIAHILQNQGRLSQGQGSKAKFRKLF